MASSLSEEEFHRLQEQLIDLRTTNYSLDEKYKKLLTENQVAVKKMEKMEKELGEAFHTIKRSKKIREVEVLVHENNGLQQKLVSQEEDFRLQNDTVMKELTLLVAANEKLEQEIQFLTEKYANCQCELTDDDILRASSTTLEQSQSENLKRLHLKSDALDDAFFEEKYRVNQELSAIKETMQQLVETADNLVQERAQAPSSVENAVIVKLQSDEVLYQNIREIPEFLDTLKEVYAKLDTMEGVVTGLLDIKVDLEIATLDLRKYKQKAATLESNLQSKQATLEQLQEEKEQLYCDSKKQYDELRDAKDDEIGNLQEQKRRLQTQLNHSQAVVQELKERIASMELASKQDIENNKILAENGRLQEELSKALQERDTFKQRMTNFEEHVNQLRDNLEKANALLEKSNKVSEKRKCLLDDMSACMEQKKEELKKQIEEMKLEHDTILEGMKEQLQIAEAELVRLHCLEKELENEKMQLASMKEQKEWLERCHNEAEEARTELAAVIDKLKSVHEEEKDAMTAESKAMEEKLQAELSELTAVIEQQKEEIAKLQQQLKDADADCNLLKKKIANVRLEMKRHVQTERQRGDRLQERLREYLNESKGNLTDATQKAEGSKEADTNSISSWSMMSGNLEQRGTSTREGSLVAGSPPGPNNNGRDGVHDVDFEQENLKLVSRVAVLQQEKWILEARISHLEEGNAAMAEDLVEKSALIEHYCMAGSSNTPASKGARKSVPEVGSSPERRPAALTDKLAKWKDLLKPGNDELSESQRRMQNMLEETLTKNMHLQDDMQKLLQELDKRNDTN